MQKALLIGYIWPEPRASAAGLRSLSLIRALREAGFETHFASPAKDGEPAQALRDAGVSTHSVRPNDPEFDAWIAKLAPEIVVIERFMMEEQFGWRVAKHSPRSLRVLDTVDLHFLRRARQRSVVEPAADPGAAAGAQAAHSDEALRELAAAYRSDCTLLISPYEIELLTDPRGPFRVPAELLHEFGLCYDPSPYAALAASELEAGRVDFAVIGGFRHEPNADGVRWLNREIWPKIRARLPNARVHIYGAYAPRDITALDDPSQGFLLKGFAPDQYAALARHLVNLAPLRFGAGLKGKITDGWWSGTPCVTTPVGAEGMTIRTAEGDALFGGEIVDFPATGGADAFAQAACRLYGDASARSRAREAGFRILSERFDHARSAPRLIDRLTELRARLAEHRSANFTGRMLAHHQHRSTEYFSRWIEAKGARETAGRPPERLRAPSAPI